MSRLNEDQQKAFVDVINFLRDPNRKYHRVSGGAGTGKSFFISKIVTDILKHAGEASGISDIGVTATTNKAAAVLSDAIPHMRTDIKTIYSYLNLRVQSDFTTGKQNIIPTAKWQVLFNTLIIIDEASMVSKVLMDYIEKGTSNTCKVLFVGDRNQLSPVGEDISPVYRSNYSESHLKQSVRNSGQPALMELCAQCVKTVETGVFTPIKEVPGVIDFINGTQLQGILEREYVKEDSTKRIVSYTNAKVLQYNDYIRQLRGYTEPFHIGEIVTNNSSAEVGNSKIRLYTDQVVEIIEVKPVYEDTQLVPGHSVDMVDVVVQDLGTYTQYELTCFAEPEDRKEVMKYYSSRKRWDKYFKIKENYPDLRPIAASTSHKAQGSTYDSVIVDLGDISKSTNKAQTARLMYVALSRPRSRVYIKGNLAERYFE